MERWNDGRILSPYSSFSFFTYTRGGTIVPSFHRSKERFQTKIAPPTGQPDNQTGQARPVHGCTANQPTNQPSLVCRWLAAIAPPGQKESTMRTQTGTYSKLVQSHIVSINYDFTTRQGTLYLAAGEYCNLEGVIRLFRRIDRKVRIIRTFSGLSADMAFVL